MTVQELVDWCKENNVSLDTQIALRAKDDYFLTPEALYVENHPYFGNCPYGDDWIQQNVPKNEEGDVDDSKIPDFLIMDTFSG